MIFARYVGPDKRNESFIEGKVYISESLFSDGETVDLSIVRIRDENNVLVEIDQSEERFVYLEENYGVAINPFDEFEIGNVLSVSGVSDDNTMYDVVGYGYRSIKDIVLLDRTNVYPGVIARKFNGEWARVVAVDESLSIMFDDEQVMIDLSSVSFAISDGDIMSIPLLTCVNNDGESELTNGRKYRLYGQRGDLYRVADNNGKEREFFASRFIFG